MTEVSYLGFVHGTMAALALMRPRGRGTIVQVGSALGERSIPLQSAYCGAKHAINGFTSSLRCELLHEKSGVQVTVVQMPAVNTPQFSWVRSRLPNHPQPVPPIYQPEVAARGVLFAADHPRPEGVLGGGEHRGHPPGQPGGPGRAGPVPGPYRLPLPADRAEGRGGPPRQPAPPGRREQRARSRPARDLRRQVPRPQPAAVDRPACPVPRPGCSPGRRSPARSSRGGADAAGDFCHRASDGPRYLRGGAGPGARPGDPPGHGACPQPAGVPGGAGARDPAPGPGRADRGGAGAGGARGGRAGRCRARRVDAAAGGGQPGRTPGRPDRRADRGGPGRCGLRGR